MSGIRIVSDTNPLIYLLNGDEQVARHLDGKECWISVITELELFGKKELTTGQKKEIELLVNSCFVTDILPDIKRLVKSMQQELTIKLPDAIIASTALYLDLPLITSDKGFKKVPGLQLILIDF